MDDLNKGHPTSNLDNWPLNQLLGMGGMGSSQTGALTEHQCIAWASHYWSDYVLFAVSPLPDWPFGLEYNSLSVSHILAQETCALITTHRCYYWKDATDSPRGQHCANDRTPRWTLKIKRSLFLMPGQALLAKHSVTLSGGGLSRLTCAARHLIMKVRQHYPFIFILTKTEILFQTSVSHTAAVGWPYHLSKVRHRSYDQRQMLILHKIEVVYLNIWCAKVEIGYTEPLILLREPMKKTGSVLRVYLGVCICVSYVYLQSFTIFLYHIPPSHTWMLLLSSASTYLLWKGHTASRCSAR